MLAETEAYTSVLLVDDDRDDYLLTKDLVDRITGAQYRLQWAQNYVAAVDALRTGTHAVCLLDYRLGERTGIELLVQVLADGCTTPIILLTGRGNGAVEKQALSAGASDYLVKEELDVDVLYRALRHATERSHALLALRERDRLFRAVFDATLDPMLISDDAGRYVDGNPAALKFFRLSHAELLTKSRADIAPLSADVIAEAADRLRHDGTATGEWALRTVGAGERLVEYRAIANILPGRHLSVLRDVTERRRADAASGRLAAIVESAEDAIIAVDLAGRIAEWNPGAQRVFGWSAAEAVGMPIARLIPARHQDELAMMATALARGDSVRNFETVRQRNDGSAVDVSLTVAPLSDRTGKIVGSATIARDITETNKLRQRLAIADRMASLGTLAAGVAHEINNPLSAVIANVDLALEAALERCAAPMSPQDTREIVEELRDARDAAERVRLIVKDLKVFSRADERANERVDVAEVLDSTIRMVTNEIRHRATLVTDYRAVPSVDAHKSRLGQVFLNLLVNAAQAIPEGNAHGNHIFVRAGVEGPNVVVEIEDTGTGIDPSRLEQVFEPFVTTKPVGVGTGLGLPICRTIVDSLGGSISVKSAVGRGTTFRVSLPIGVLGEARLRSPAGATVRSRRARVLIVDDDALLLRALTRVVGEHHDVTTVTDGRDALRRIKEGDRYDVVLCDVMMPVMTGIALHAELAAIAPDTAGRMVFMTGGAFTAQARAFLDTVPNRILEKPIAPRDLQAVLDDRMR
jgi:PAS domain S-box-containing protein